MLGLEMYVNGWKVCTAGVELGTLHGTVILSRQLADLTDAEGLSQISVLPLTGTSQRRWPRVKLSLGDEVRFRVVETEIPDKPERDSDR